MNLYSKFNKLSLLLRILIIIISIIVILKIYQNLTDNTIEGFSQESKFVRYEKINEIFDYFYADIYDQILSSSKKNEFEIETTFYVAKPDKKSYILDVGSGTGFHVDTFRDNNIKAIGIDKSPAMVAYAQKQYPHSEYFIADATDGVIFNDHTFTHITCYYFTIYYIQDKRTFLNNCFNWLKPKGYLVLHLVNKNKFDPIVPPANPLQLISPQKYAKERITQSFIKFNNFDYKSQFKLEDNSDNAYFEEVFKYKDGNVRKNRHKLYMTPQKDILSTAKDVGFSYVTKLNMVNCGYEYQYLVFLQKK